MLRVVVLDWMDYLGRGQEYVEKMASMVSRHLWTPAVFHVVTEHLLPEGRRGWFNKLHLLEMFDDEVLYIDLDCVIAADITHLVELARTDPSKIWARNDWSYPLPGRNDGREATINSSVLFWSGRKDMSGLTDKMIAETHGDQGCLTQLFWPDGIGFLPGPSVCSYKYDFLTRGEHGDICVYHGNPKPHECTDEWTKEHWR